MSKFALIEISAIKGKQKFYKILKDNVCKFDEFEKEARINFNNEMDRIYALMDRLSNIQTLTLNQFKDITPKRELVKEIEIKTHHLRVYAIHETGTGKIIICGGNKNTQENDIKHFREVKKQYLYETS